jgi:hypothetical protein
MTTEEKMIIASHAIDFMENDLPMHLVGGEEDDGECSYLFYEWWRKRKEEYLKQFETK